MNNLRELRKINKENITKAVSYEKKESYEMAYIYLWSILEKGLSLYANEAVKVKLQSQVKQWDKFLTGVSNKRPAAIKSFNTEYKSRSIPQVTQIESMLGKMNQVSKVLNTKGKWRIRRNNIAHNAADFYNAEKYKEYKYELLKAIDELLRKAALYATKNKA